MAIDIKFGRNEEAMNNPCVRCFALYVGAHLVGEMVRPLPRHPSIGLNGEDQCPDCQAAETLLKLGIITVDLRAFMRGNEKAIDDYFVAFRMARIAIGNERMEQFRLPGAQMGLVKMGIMRPSAPGDFEKHMRWMDVHIPRSAESENE